MATDEGRDEDTRDCRLASVARLLDQAGAPVSLLATPDDARIPALIAKWPDGYTYRSQWLGELEDILREHYPWATSDSLTLTARSLAPFPLARPGVP